VPIVAPIDAFSVGTGAGGGRIGMPSWRMRRPTVSSPSGFSHGTLGLVVGTCVRLVSVLLRVRADDGDPHSVGANHGSVTERHVQIEWDRWARRDIVRQCTFTTNRLTGVKPAKDDESTRSEGRRCQIRNPGSRRLSLASFSSLSRVVVPFPVPQPCSVERLAARMTFLPCR